MNSKKLLLLMLTAAMVTCSKPVLAYGTSDVSTISTHNSIASISQSAVSKITAEQAKHIAKDAFKKYFDITIDDSNSNFDVRQSDDNVQALKNYWYVNFNMNNGNEYLGGSVSIDQNTGKIISFNNHIRSNYRNSNSIKSIPTITEDTAKATAEAFIMKLAPEEIKSTKLLKNDYIQFSENQTYSFSYTRFINDIPLYDNSIHVSVDKFTGKVLSYFIEWTDNLNLPSKAGIMDENKGAALVSDNTKMSMCYTPSRDSYNPQLIKGTKLVYTRDTDTSNVIDAKTGKVISMYIFTGQKVKSKDITSQKKEEFYKTYQPSKKLAKALTSDEAEKLAKEKLKSIFDKNIAVASAGYGERSSGINEKRIKTWNVSFNIKDSDALYNDGDISINAATGEILGIYVYDHSSGENGKKFIPKITSEQAYDKAVQIIGKLYPEKIKEINTKQNIIDPSGTNYNLDFYFERLVNGLPYKYDGININFSAKTGDLLNLNCDWEELIFVSSPTNTVSSDTAKKNFISNNKPELMYMLTYNDSNSKNTNKEAKLVYAIYNQYGNSVLIDAFTGKPLNNYGQDLVNDFTKFQNTVKGSSVEKEANTLASNKIIDIKDFKLDGNITNLQFIKILTNIKNNNIYFSNNKTNIKISTTLSKDSADYKYLELAVNAGILENSGEFKPSDFVTREQASMYLIKLLQFDIVGKLKDAFSFEPADKASISPDYIGYVSLAKALGLIDVDTRNNIRPKDNITMEEVVKAIYKAAQ